MWHLLKNDTSKKKRGEQVRVSMTADQAEAMGMGNPLSMMLPLPDYDQNQFFAKAPNFTSKFMVRERNVPPSNGGWQSTPSIWCPSQNF